MNGSYAPNFKHRNLKCNHLCFLLEKDKAIFSAKAVLGSLKSIVDEIPSDLQHFTLARGLSINAVIIKHVDLPLFSKYPLFKPFSCQFTKSTLPIPGGSRQQAFSL